MSQQQKTASTNQYNQPSMGVFNQLNPQFGQAISSEITNPYNNAFFNQQLGMGQQQLGQQGASGQQALLQRAQALGQSGNSALMQSQQGMLQRQGMAGQSNLFNNLLMQSGQMRQSAMGMAQGYNPLQTGQTGIGSVSGVGSWLPQAIGAGGAAASMFGNKQQGGNDYSSAWSNANNPWGGQGPYANQDTSPGAFSEGEGPYGNPSGENMMSPFFYTANG